MDFLGRESNSSILALLQLLYIGYPNKDVKLIVKYKSLDHRLDVWVEDPLKGFKLPRMLVEVVVKGTLQIVSEINFKCNRESNKEF